MSVELQNDGGEQSNTALEMAHARRRVLIQLAKRTGITEPESAAVDAEELLDGQQKRALLHERGWTVGRYTVASALSILYQSVEQTDELLSDQAEVGGSGDPSHLETSERITDPTAQKRSSDAPTDEEFVLPETSAHAKIRPRFDFNRSTPQTSNRTYTRRAKAEQSDPSPRQTRSRGPAVSQTSHEDAFANLDATGQYLKKAGRRALLSAEEEVELAKDIEAGLYAAQRLAWLNGEPVKGFEQRPRRKPNNETMVDLEIMAERGKQAKNHLMEANLRLVVSVAKRYIRSGLDFEDLTQEGNLGLIRAVEKFDYTKGFKFSTYATWWIRQAITRGIAEKTRTIQLPVHLVEKVNKLARIKRELSQDMGREPSHVELSQESGIPRDKIADMLRYSQGTSSLDMPIGSDDDASLGDIIEDEQGQNPQELVERTLMLDMLSNAMDMLSDREQAVIRLRYGLEDGISRTSLQVAKKLDITHADVRRLEQHAKKKLRTGEYSDALRDYAG